MPVNLRHPLAEWLVANADAIATDAPAVFARLRDALDADPASVPTPNDEVNHLLDRFTRVRPNLAPPPEAYLNGPVETGTWRSR
jgi:hypothetical protein